MVLSLELATGKIQRYQTIYSGLGENPSYKTKCGKVWPKCPDPEEECDHLGCALKAAEREAYHAILFLLFGLFFIILGSSQEMNFDDLLIIIVVSFNGLILVFMVWVLYKSLRDKMQLEEYRDKGTIRGVRAWKYMDLL